ncbi:CBS domain-containing protein [Candidatus Woesearchaeota archaeon]|nr:CBS domain-containing protein [Candidatus Woesearchaeota archaeon]
MESLLDLAQLNHLRTNLGWSQHDLAKKAGVSQSLIAKIETGKIDPSLSNARKIAKALAAETPTGAMVKQVMSRNVLSFPPETPVLEAINVMRKRGISQLPVIDKGVVVGRVTETSILEHVEELATATLHDVMSPPPPLVDKATLVNAIVPLLQAYNSVLVLDKGVVIGIVTKADVMGAALQHKL